MRYPLAAAVIALATFVFPSSARSDWTVHNNLNEPFTVVVWPQSQPNQVSKRTINAGNQGTLRLGPDNHLVQLISGGGDVYSLRPTSLQNRGTTNLKTILTPDGRRNGRINYAYMNQRGFDKNNQSGTIRELARSNWETKYVLPDNTEKQARVEFRGGGGWCRTSDSVGELSNLRFRVGRNGEVLIDGDWKKAEHQGRLEFTIDGGGQRLTGRWTTDGTEWRAWSGTRR